jgi:hypothetical protein
MPLLLLLLLLRPLQVAVLKQIASGELPPLHHVEPGAAV